VAHYVDYAREGFACGEGIEEGEAAAAGDKVDGGLRVFVSDRITDFGFDVCVIDVWCKIGSEQIKGI
jgi:hypothetical protein